MKWRVSAQESGSKLIVFLQSKITHIDSLRAFKKAIERNSCTINGCLERYASAIVQTGDIVEFQTQALQKTPAFEATRILYEDEWILVYNKPAELICDANSLYTYFRSELLLVHRLDRYTTGVLLLAKDRQTQKKLEEQFRQRLVDKTYHVLVDGILSKQQGVIKNFLGKIRSLQGQAVYGQVSEDQGDYAETKWRLLHTGDHASYVACFPKTGRTHQIRAHMSGIGHSVLGDYQYVKQFVCPYRPLRYLLHAYELAFVHPFTEKPLKLTAPFPPDFKMACLELFDLEIL